MLSQVSDDELIERLLGRKLGWPLGDLLNLNGVDLEQAGFSKDDASAIMLVAEIARRHQPTEGPKAISQPRHAVALLAELRHATSSRLLVILLDRSHRVLGRQSVAEATVGCATISPYGVAEAVARHGAASAILAHNHLSGIATATPQDLDFTNHCTIAFNRRGVQLADHLVVARRDWVSFRQSGWLD